MINESGGRAVVIAPSALGSKDHPARRSKVPLRRIRQAIYPTRRIRRRNVEQATWRVFRHGNLPSSPSTASGNEVWKAEGVSTFSLGVLVRGHDIHNFTKDYHGAAGTVWDGTGVFSPPQAGKFWAPVVNGTGSHRQFFCFRCDGMGRDNLRLDGTGTGREMSHDF